MTRTRIGSDDARRWVRSLRLGNPYAKAILLATANYTNDDGTAFPGLETLHADTEIAVNTITARLRWCEQIGAITVSKCWVDEHGNRNKAGRGRPTSWEIKFLLDADIEAIAAAADDQTPDRALRGAAKQKHEEKVTGSTDESDEISHSPGHALEEVLPISSQSVANHLPITGASRILESESPIPKPLSETERGFQEKADQEAQAEKRWEQFRTSGYPDGIVNLDLTHREFLVLDEINQSAAVAGIPVYADRCKRRKEKSKAAHLYLRHKVWQGLGAVTIADGKARATSHPPNSRAGRALLRLAQVARYNLFRLSTGNISYLGEITPQLLALADAPEDQFLHDRGTAEFASWRDFIGRIFPGRALPALTRVETPWQWPPRKDGSIIRSTDPPAELSDEDARALTGM